MTFSIMSDAQEKTIDLNCKEKVGMGIYQAKRKKWDLSWNILFQEQTSQKWDRGCLSSDTDFSSNIP